MVKKILAAFTLTVFSFANFNTACVSCHKAKDVDLRKTFMNALLVYGGEKNFKTALFYYCKNPIYLNSVMDEEFVKKYLPLKPVKLSDSELKKMLNIYWEKYKVIGNLK